jgi:copper chaperone NosL
MRTFVTIATTLLLSASLSSCIDNEVAELPPPAILTDEAMGYYCNMTVTEHQGPKGQIILKSLTKPVWFSSVRDTIAFTLLPEEPRQIEAIYVTDMSSPGAWENPENGDWIEALSAYYVTGSSKNGGMGAPEPIPFSTEENATVFVEQYGGEIVVFADIPRDSILGSVEISSSTDGEGDDG